MFAKHRRTNTDASARPVRQASFSSLPARTLILHSTANSGSNTPAHTSPRPHQTAQRKKNVTALEAPVEEPLFQESFLTSPIFDMSAPVEEVSPHFSPAEFHDTQESFSPPLDQDLLDEFDNDDELSLDELASRITILDSDVARTVYIARAGRPKMIDVSPSVSIRARPASIAVYNASSINSSAHSRSSSYFAANQLRRSRSSSASSHERSDSDARTSGTFSSAGPSPTSERASNELIDTVPEEIMKSVQFFPDPPSRVTGHRRKQLSASAPRSLRDKVQTQQSDDFQTSARSSLSLDTTSLSERKGSRFPNPLTRKTGGWFRRT